MSKSNIPTTSVLEIALIPRSESTVARLNGRLNIDSSPLLRDRLLAILKSEPPVAVVVDLAEVFYIDASGIATLIEALKMARNRRTTLRLQGLHGPLHHLLEVTGVLSLFETNSRETSGRTTASSVAKVH